LNKKRKCIFTLGVLYLKCWVTFSFTYLIVIYFNLSFMWSIWHIVLLLGMLLVEMLFPFPLYYHEKSFMSKYVWSMLFLIYIWYKVLNFFQPCCKIFYLCTGLRILLLLMVKRVFMMLLLNDLNTLVMFVLLVIYGVGIWSFSRASSQCKSHSCMNTVRNIFSRWGKRWRRRSLRSWHET